MPGVGYDTHDLPMPSLELGLATEYSVLCSDDRLTKFCLTPDL